jgi:hypothetical protein
MPPDTALSLRLWNTVLDNCKDPPLSVYVISLCGDGPTSIGLEAEEGLLPLAQLLPLLFLAIWSLFSPRLPFYLLKFELGDMSFRLLSPVRGFPCCCARLR